ncbi:MAG: 30S ribosomal protein S16 [Candidatus Shikimatogenerans sp. Tcar]|uniref:Small ribosomal subunit protein bS16 n=1 Tax=Candidatus Shikimatogenerans sp. Tcar TaxID=3158565 RepID=A0AAU7QSK9_9FLAO
MSVRIRLQKKGKKRYKVYRIVVANSKSPRNGKIIYKLGFYNPNLKNNNIILNIKKTIFWIKLGALPNKKTFFLLKNMGINIKNILNNKK